MVCELISVAQFKSKNTTQRWVLLYKPASVAAAWSVHYLSISGTWGRGAQGWKAYLAC